MKNINPDWTLPDKEGMIHAPDELDPIISKVATQIRFHTISGKSEGQTICDIVEICRQFFLTECNKLNQK